MSTPRAAGEVGLGRLIDLDPTLAEGWTSDGDGSAIATARVPFVAVSPGRWSPDTLPSSVSRPFALLVADGLVLHQLQLADSVAAEILGPGDILTPDLEPDPLLPARRSFLVGDAARIAILDARLIPVLAGAPVIGVRLVARAAEQFRRASAHRAIVALPRVEDRILALFGHLAERWGRVGAVGLVVPLALTHEGIGHLIGARRPTVSLGLKSLAEDDALDRRADGSWVLSQVALRRLAPAGGNGLPDAAAVALVRGTETVLRSHRPASPMVPSSREPERMTPTVAPPQLRAAERIVGSLAGR